MGNHKRGHKRSRPIVDRPSPEAKPAPARAEAPPTSQSRDGETERERALREYNEKRNAMMNRSRERRVDTSRSFTPREPANGRHAPRGQAYGGGRGGGGRHGGRGPRGGGDDGKMPEIGSIHRGTVKKIADFGAFVEMEGYYKHGLVHISQLSEYRVDKVSDVVAEGDRVYVKVIKLDGGKVSLSLRYADQGSGKDLDPNMVKFFEDDSKRGAGGKRTRKPMEAEAVLARAACGKCGQPGHLATQCYNAKSSSTKGYELVGSDVERQLSIMEQERKIKAQAKRAAKLARKGLVPGGVSGGQAVELLLAAEGPEREALRRKLLATSDGRALTKGEAKVVAKVEKQLAKAEGRAARKEKKRRKEDKKEKKKKKKHHRKEKRRARSDSESSSAEESRSRSRKRRRRE